MSLEDLILNVYTARDEFAKCQDDDSCDAVIDTEKELVDFILEHDDALIDWDKQQADYMQANEEPDDDPHGVTAQNRWDEEEYGTTEAHT